MKKLSFIVLAILSLFVIDSCQKDFVNETQDNFIVKASYEDVLDSDGTKVSISESGSTFSLAWEAGDVVNVANLTNNVYKADQPMVGSPDGANAMFSISLPNVDGDVTDYILTSSSFVSRSISQDKSKNFLRGAIATSQSYDANSLAESSFLVAINKNCPVGDPGESFSFKTMNSFLKFEVTNGDKVNYPKMYLYNIKVETVGEEQIAGRFGINLLSNTWSTAYGEDTGINDSDKSSVIMLNCGNKEIGDSPVAFYVAAAFGTYSKGLKVTFTVKDGNDNLGEVVKYISNNTEMTLQRNVLYKYPAVALQPQAVVVDTYTLISTISAINTTDTYYMAAKKGDNYHIWGGTFSGGQLVTGEYTYQDNVLTGTGDMEAVKFVSTGVANQYNVMVGTKYLVSDQIAANKMGLADSAPAPFVISNDARGGIRMLYGFTDVETNCVHLASAGTASSKYIRGYLGLPTVDKGTEGIYFFKKN